MRKMKRFGALALATAMTASMTVPAMAATTPIEALDVKINYSIEAGSDEWDVDVDCLDSRVEYNEDDDFEINAPEEGEPWEDNVKPRVKFTLRLDKEDDYQFKNIDKSAVNLTITGPEGILEENQYKYTVSDYSKKVTITVTLPELEYEEGYWESLLMVDDVYWDDNGVARWEENESADYYEFKLYRGSSALTSIVKTEYTEADLSQYFTRKGDYKVRVRAVYGKEKGDWVDDEISVDSEEAEYIRDNGGELETGDVSSNNTNSSNTSNSTVNNNAAGPGANSPANNNVSLPDYVVKGTWSNPRANVWTFKDSNGVAYKNKWAAVYNPYANVAAGQQNFDWFYFDGNGYMVTGWVLDGGRYYYLSEVSDGTLGRMVTDWKQIGGAWYYFNPKSDGTRGAMYVNTWIGNDYVGADGRFVPGKTR